MGERIFQFLRHFFNHFGYWTVAIALLLENAGVPVPGETILLFASFLAYSERHLHLPYIILMGIVACTLGDNIGYWLGYRGGRRMLLRYQHIFHIRQSTLERGERLFARYGSHTIFFARFIVGMRIIAGPMAGVLRMPWRSFALFNFLGATLWVTVIALIGYFFGSEWDHMVRVLNRVDTGLLIALAAVVVILWWRHRRRAARRALGDGNGGSG